MSRKITRGEKLVNEFESNIRTHEMMGSHPPETWRETELEFKLARANLLTYIQLLESLHHEKMVNKTQ